MCKRIMLGTMIVAIVLSMVFIACGKKEKAKNTSTPPATTQTKTTPVKQVPVQTPSTVGAAKTVTPAPQQAPPPKIESGKVAAVIEMKKGGRIVMELYPKEAPITVGNFVKLANKGFYNGLKFHRVIPGFVAQGGDPVGDGTGGPGYTIKDEFNSHKHLAGTVAMAKIEAPNSAGSQFYICLAPQPSLDGQYTVFGQVTEGMDIVNGIQIGNIMSKVYVIDKRKGK